MIVYDLLCICGYQFEGWFHDADDFCRQQQASLLQCPQCNGHEIKKILSPVATMNTHSAGGADLETGDNQQQLLQQAKAVLRQVQQYVLDNYENVGTRLAEESLKIHYGLEEPRNIRGVASEAEEKQLQKEGIQLLKIPLPAQADDDDPLQ